MCVCVSEIRSVCLVRTDLCIRALIPITQIYNIRFMWSSASK